MIALGRCPNSSGIQFYNPENCIFVLLIDYNFQHNVMSDAFDESTSIFLPTFPIDSSVHVHTHSPPSLGTIIGIPSSDCKGLLLLKVVFM